MTPTPPRKLLVIMTKEPVSGKVKTRLTPPLTQNEAANLYRCFLQDRFLEVDGLEAVDIAIAYAPITAGKYFLNTCREKHTLFAQRGTNLGEKLSWIFKEKLSEGYTAVSVTGCDFPDLPNRFVRASFDLLMSEQADIVFGPSFDGGYYLVAMKKLHPEVFVDIPWSTEHVLSQSLERAAQLKLHVELLPPWNDLDRFEDLLGYYRKYKDFSGNEFRAGKITFSYLLNSAQIQNEFIPDR